MRVLLGVLLHSLWRAAIGVAFAENRIDGAAFDFVVASFNRFFFRSGWFVRVVGDCEAVALEFGDGCFELRNRGTDVRQLDNVGFRTFGEFAEFGQRIADALVFFQVVRKVGKNTTGQ